MYPTDSGAMVYDHPLTTSIRLPVYNKKFRLFRRKAYMFSLKFTCLDRTSVNTDNRQFLMSRITNSHISSTPPRFADTVFQSTFYMTEYLCKEPNRNGKWWLAALDCLFCHNHVLIVDIVQGHPTTIFGRISVRNAIWDLNFRNICCKISCLPASPRIFEHVKNGVIAYF